MRPGSVGLAILLSLVALTLFDVMGLIIKYLTDRYAASELSAYRNLFGLIPAGLMLWLHRGWHRRGRPVAIRQWKLACARGGMVSMAQLCFYLTLGEMEFATTTTISYSTALFTTALAVPLLGERVGPLRWSAVVVGFVGVMMVMGLGQSAFTWYALLSVGAAFFYALSAVTARLFEEAVPTALINVYSAGAAAVAAFAIALADGGFTPIASSGDLAWIFAMGMVGGSAVICLIVAYRMTEPSNLAPFSYFGIPLAFVMGWAVFDEAPFGDLFPGALLIVAGGLMIVWRERMLARRARRGV